MADQDSQDINQMMSETAEVEVARPRKSRFLWVVLGCVVVGVGLGVFVYQQSIKSTVKPSATPKPTAITSLPSPIESPVTPDISLVQPQPKTVSFPKAGEVRVYYQSTIWMPLGMILKDTAGTHNLAIATGTPTTQMKILDTGYVLTGPTTITIDSFLGDDRSKLSIGWAKPVSNKCGFNGFGVIDITQDVTFATAQAKGQPIVSVQCWGDYSPNPTDTSALDFNDYVLIWSYTPVAGSTSPSPSPSSSPTTSPSPSPSPSASVMASVTPTPTPTPTPSSSPRVVIPDTTDGVPVTGVFEVTVASVSMGLIFLVLGLFGLIAL